MTFKHHIIFPAGVCAISVNGSVLLAKQENMRKLIVVLVVMVICVAMVTAGKKDRERKDRRKEGKRGRFDLRKVWL